MSDFKNKKNVASRFNWILSLPKSFPIVILYSFFITCDKRKVQLSFNSTVAWKFLLFSAILCIIYFSIFFKFIMALKWCHFWNFVHHNLIVECLQDPYLNSILIFSSVLWVMPNLKSYNNHSIMIFKHNVH